MEFTDIGKLLEDCLAACVAELCGTRGSFFGHVEVLLAVEMVEVTFGEQPERFAGKRVLIIDDIVTTGATLAECSRTLLQAGASDVVYAAFAAPRKQD